MVWVIPSRIYR
ncbi:DEAD/DEAH box helicase family protein, partial [Vibrio parahaemolyticus V-223/04]